MKKHVYLVIVLGFTSMPVFTCENIGFDSLLNFLQRPTSPASQNVIATIASEWRQADKRERERLDKEKKAIARLAKQLQQHAEGYRCYECNPPVPHATQKRLETHMRIVHGKSEGLPPLFRCLLCKNFSTTSENGLRIHEGTCTNPDKRPFSY